MQRPWITPNDILAYTEYPLVKERAENKLESDITRAELFVSSYTNNKFESLDVIPVAVKTATLLIAESYAFNACASINDKKSETFDDYSYTIDKRLIDISELGIDSLLHEFIIPKSTSNVSMKLRRL